ncbi:MAG: hypothetical protein AB1816_14330 [Bacillota bacterium]
MPIKGWKVVRLPRCGKIALGRRDEQGLPRAVDYFITPPEVQAVYEALYRREGRECEYDDEGTLKIRELDIMIPVDDEDTFAPYWLKRYGGMSLICRGDGETATVDLAWLQGQGREEYPVAWDDKGPVDTLTGERLEVQVGPKGRAWVRVPCPYEKCPHYQKKLCREVFILSVILPRVNMMGVYSLDSSSWNSFNDLLNSLELLREAQRRRGGPGDVSFIPMTLKVNLKKVAFETVGKDGRVRRLQKEVPVLSLALGVSASEFFALKPGGPGVTVEVEEPDEDQKPDLLYPPFPEDGDGGGPDGGGCGPGCAADAPGAGRAGSAVRAGVEEAPAPAGAGRAAAAVPDVGVSVAAEGPGGGWEYEGPPAGAEEVGAQGAPAVASGAPEPAPPPGPVRGQYRVLSAGKSAGSGPDVYAYVWAEPATGGKVVLYGRGDTVLDVAALQEGDLVEVEGVVPEGRADVLVAARVVLLGSLRRPADARKVDTVLAPEGGLKVGRLDGREFVSWPCRDWQGDRRVLFALDGGPVDDLAGLEKGVRYRVRGYAWRDFVELVQVVGPAGK